METSSTRASIAHSDYPKIATDFGFDPAQWLARYTALGGVYVANGKLNLCILVNKQTEAELSQIRQLIVDLTEDERAAILAHVHAGGSPRPLDWQGVVAKYEADSAAFSNHPYGRTRSDDPAYERLHHESGKVLAVSEASLRLLVTTAAPDHAALRRKIETIAAEYGDTYDVFEPLLADVDRLGGGASKETGTDQVLLAAWDRRASAYARYNALPHSEEPNGAYTPEERAEWDIIDSAEELIRSAVAATPQGAAVQLWAALQHTTDHRWDDEACQRRDLDALESRGDELDWNVRLIVAALRSLKSMEA